MDLQKYIAEAIGTACLVLLGCGSVVIGGYGAEFPLGALPVAMAFGITILMMAYAIGPVSGCHINPAVTLAVWLAGRMKTSDVPFYIIAQCIGAIVGAFVLMMIVSGKISGYSIATQGLAENGWGQGYLGGYNMNAAMLVEFIGTFILTFVVLGSTGKGTTPVAGVAIGFTVMVLIIVFINVSGLSVNPARSLGPALLVGGKAMEQLWLFILVPLAAGAVSGLLYRSKIFD